MNFKNLTASQKNILKTLAFYLIYILIALILFYMLPNGICAPGPNAILILLAPFIVGIFTIVNLIKTFLNKEHLSSLIIHFSILIVLLILINSESHNC
jgi:succinate-acetate transporter protein